jgi:hypothetical protein
MKLYRVISSAIGTQDLIVKAKNAKEASQVGRDVIEEKAPQLQPYTVYVTELVQPENDGAGYCYLLNKTDRFTFKRK